MGRPRRKPPSPGRQWFVARRFPTLAASSFKAPLHLGDAVEQTDTCRPDCAVGGVARREDQDPRATQLIDKAVNLAVAPALGDANRLFRRPPFSAASAAMRLDMRAVESHSFRRFSRFGRRLEDALPNSLRTPAVEAIVDRLGRPIFRRTIDPSTSALEHMHDPAQNAPIVLRLHATLIAWNKRLNPRPLPVAKPKQVRPHLLGPPDSVDQPVESQHG